MIEVDHDQARVLVFFKSVVLTALEADGEGDDSLTSIDDREE